jgi:PAS domain S-box-containing protein
MHQLLNRQLKKYFPGAPIDNPEFSNFLNIISETYKIYDQELEFSNQSFIISEREFNLANEKLEKQAEERKESIDKLKETLLKTGLSINSINSDDDLYNISKILEEQVEKTIQIDSELKYNIQRLNTLINNHPSAILLETEKRRIAFTNQSFCNYFGIPLPASQMYGLDCSQSAEQAKHLFVDEVEFVRRIEELLENKKPVTNELLYLKDGRVLERSFIPIIIEDRYTGHFWSYDDVTEKKRTENTLIENEQRLSATLNASLDAIINVDDQFKVIFWNPQAENLFGWKQEEALGKNLTQLFVPSEYHDKHIEFLQSAFAGEPHPILESLNERPAIHKSGRLLELEFSVAVVYINHQKTMCYFIRDISERKNNETILKRSEEKYRNIIENINLGLVEYDKQLNIVYSNEAYTKMTGYDKSELIGVNALEFFKNQPNLGVFMNKITDRIKGIADIYEVEVINKSQEKRNWVVSGAPVTNMNGEMEGFVGIHLDITTQKETERKIIENESRFRMILNSALDAIVNINHLGEIIFWNPKAESLFGWTETEVLGKPLSSIIVPPRHRENHDKGVKSYDHSKGGPIMNKLIELPALTRDGKELIVELSITPIQVENEMIYCSFIRDISERIKSQRALIKSEEKYKRIIANMNLGLLEVDNDDIIQYVNNSFLKLSGYKRHELLNRKASEIFLKGQNYEVMTQKISNRNDGISDVFEISVFNKTNEVRWWLISGAPNFDENGKVIGSIGIHLDITRQKETEHQLSLAKEIAEKSSKAKETFLTNMSHEIRTPLHGIIGMIREIAKEELSNNQVHLLNNAQTASNHLLSIINNILDISKIESGEFKLNMNHFSIIDEINGVINILITKAQSKNIQLSKELEGPIAAAFIGDPAIFRQILLNLIGNAIKFSEKGVINIGCKVINSSDDSQDIEFCISDQGIGMDESYLKQLFKKFHQEDISNTRKFGGSGLGLAITKELIELMHGSIQVKSNKYIGTEITFNLNLPIGDKSQIQKIGNNDIYEILRKKSILLVEDNPMNSLVAINALRPYDAIITEATDGKKAVDILHKEKFDIVLMDIQMPVLDGIQATKIIRTKLKIDTPIIALTANAFKSELDKCKDVGMNNYVTKPFEEKDLLNTICSELAKSINQKYEKADDDYEEEEIEHLAINAIEDSKLYKLDYLIETSRGNKDFIKDMLLLFLRMIPESVSQIEAAIQSKNLIEFKGLVHKLKPSINNLRIPLAEEIKQVELLDPTLEIDSNIEKLAKNIGDTLMQCVSEMTEKEELSVH